METVISLVITAIIVVLPALLFLGLWNGLVYLRDDDLIEQIRSEGDQYAGRAVASPTSSGVRCSYCGAVNRSGMNYCKQCLREL